MKPLEIRLISQAELLLTEYLISIAKQVPEGLIIPSQVYTMTDGGMGSIRFLSASGEERYRSDLAEANYVDADGMLVIITLILNRSDELLDLEFWKVNFNPLINYPLPEQLRIIDKD